MFFNKRNSIQFKHVLQKYPHRYQLRTKAHHQATAHRVLANLRHDETKFMSGDGCVRYKVRGLEGDKIIARSSNPAEMWQLCMAAVGVTATTSTTTSSSATTTRLAMSSRCVNNNNSYITSTTSSSLPTTLTATTVTTAATPNTQSIIATTHISHNNKNRRTRQKLGQDFGQDEIILSPRAGNHCRYGHHTCSGVFRGGGLGHGPLLQIICSLQQKIGKHSPPCVSTVASENLGPSF